VKREKEGVVGNQVDIKELEKVMRVISEPGSRAKFKKDAKAALRDAGVTVGAIPDALVDALDGMSEKELEVIAQLNTTMVQAGLTAEGSKLLGRAV
jgi:hypothetical protein